MQADFIAYEQIALSAYVQSQRAVKTTEGLVAAGEAALYESLPAGTPACTLHVTCMSVAIVGSMLPSNCST